LHYYNNDLPDKAIEIYNAILAVNPNDMAAIKGGKDASARLTMQTSWEGKDSYRDIMKDKEQAVLLEQQNRVVKDEDVIEAQLAELGAKYEADNTNIEVVKKIAALYEQKGELSTAASWYSYAASLGNNTDATLVRKATDLGLKILDVQVRDLSGWLKENDETHPEYSEKKGQYEVLKAQRAENQVFEAKRRVERNPTDLQLRYELGEVLMSAGQYREALPELQKARQNPNARIKALNLLAQCMVKLNMLDLAEGQFKTAISELSSMDDTKKDLLYNLGLVYEKLGKKDDYLDCMKRIFETDFGYRDVAERVEASYR
jgi:tetratricopeptide (TPR) repeat protein